MHDCRLLRGVLRSSRPANIPTLFTNAAAAWASVRGAELPPLALYGGVVLMGLCFYLYGMWENDRVDARWDASRYPDRPVPCGAVSVSVLRLLSLVAGLSGLVLNMALGGEFAAGAVLLIVISLYNMFHKLWSGSVFLMGLCRGLWVLAAGLVFAHAAGDSVLPASLLWYAFGLFVFTCLISMVARREAGRPRVQAAVVLLLSGMCLFDAVWLLCLGSLLWIGAVLLWAGTRLLQKLACQVVLARDGIEAVEHALRDEFDLVFMDCQMPRMDGLQATQASRTAEPRGRRLPIVALTASTLESERADCLLAGMDDFLGKPIDVAELRRVLGTWCSPEAAMAPAAMPAPAAAGLSASG